VRRRIGALACVAGLAMGAVACSGDDNDDNQAPADAPQSIPQGAPGGTTEGSVDDRDESPPDVTNPGDGEGADDNTGEG
jgi:hypothetical protein